MDPRATLGAMAGRLPCHVAGSNPVFRSKSPAFRVLGGSGLFMSVASQGDAAGAGYATSFVLDRVSESPAWRSARLTASSSTRSGRGRSAFVPVRAARRVCRVAERGGGLRDRGRGARKFLTACTSTPDAATPSWLPRHPELSSGRARGPPALHARATRRLWRSRGASHATRQGGPQARPTEPVGRAAPPRRKRALLARLTRSPAPRE